MEKNQDKLDFLTEKVRELLESDEMCDFLTEEVVNENVENIREIAERGIAVPEGHQYEDALFRGVLAAIAMEKCANPVACAKAALKSLNLDFDRYYE